MASNFAVCGPHGRIGVVVGHTPLFSIDAWDHAYYLKYLNRRADYLAAVVQVVHWDFVSARSEELTK